MTVVSIDASCETVICETEVETDVVGRGSLPFEVLVVNLRTVERTGSCYRIVCAVAIVLLVEREVVIVTDTLLLTGLSITQTEFEVADGF